MMTDERRFAATTRVLLAAALLAVGASISACDEKDSDEQAASEEASSTEKKAEPSKAEEEPTPESEGLPAAKGSMAVRLFETESGFGMSWLEPAGGAEAEESESSYALRFAEWDGSAWSEPKTVVESSQLFTNWADLPSVRALGSDRYLAHWLVGSEEKSDAYDIVFARSADGGESWDELGSPHEDGTATQHGFVSTAPVNNGTLAVWLDGRARAEGNDGSMALRGRVVAGSNGTKDSKGEESSPFAGSSTLLDDRVCDCCPTDAVRVEDSVVVVYRDRSKEEVRDISVLRRVGDEWTEPAPVAEEGWKIDGCPVNGPAVAADGTTVATAWYTEAGGEPRVRAAISDDGGRDFGSPFDVAGGSGDPPIGRVDVAFLDGDVVVSWMEEGPEDASPAAIRVARCSADGERGGAIEVGETSKGTRSGMPRITALEDRLFVVWRTYERPPTLKGKTLEAQAIPPPGKELSAESGEGVDEAYEHATELPDLGATKLAGGTSKLSAVEPPVLVNLWATWCAPCKAEMPLLKKVQEKWSSKGLSMIGLSVEGKQSTEKLKTFAENNEEPFEIWYAPARDPLSIFGANAVPATFLYNAQGELVWVHDGRIEEEALAELQEKVASVVER